MSAERDADLLVIGGGPAGLATAIHAVRSGLRAVVLDGRRPPVDKACGEGVMPDGVAELAALGVEVPTEGSAPFAGIRYLDGHDVAEGRFPGAPGLGVRRLHLHAAMVERAAAEGVDLRWGVTANRLASGGVETEHGRLQTAWVVGADGLNSRVRVWAGLEGAPPSRLRYAVRRHFTLEPWNDLVEVHFAEGAEAYVTPVGPRRVGVALLLNGEAGRFDELMPRFPALVDRLVGAPVESRDRGAGPFARHCRSVVRENLALVGDAAGYLDPITGDGVSLALHQARALVQAIASGDLSGYARAHRRIARLPEALTRLLLFAEARPPLRRRLVRALAAAPDLFSCLLGVHSRQRPLSAFGISGVGRLGALLARG